jgi:hypothetical protein
MRRYSQKSEVLRADSSRFNSCAFKMLACCLTMSPREEQAGFSRLEYREFASKTVFHLSVCRFISTKGFNATETESTRPTRRIEACFDACAHFRPPVRIMGLKGLRFSLDQACPTHSVPNYFSVLYAGCKCFMIVVHLEDPASDVIHIVNLKLRSGKEVSKQRFLDRCRFKVTITIRGQILCLVCGMGPFSLFP